MTEVQAGFKGWQVLGASFINAMLLAGASIYSFQLFVTPLETEFGLTREQSYSGIIVFYVSIAMWAAFVGRTFKGVSPRLYALAGAFAFALGFVIVSRLNDPKMMLLTVFVLVGFGFTACGPFICNALTTNWFYRRRGRALGIAAIATSAGGFLIVPLFSRLMTVLGWRDATLVTGMGIAVISTALTLIFIRSRPEDIGQYPDGASKPVAESVSAKRPAQILKNPEFWLIAVACGLLLGSDQALMSSLVPYGEEQGFGRARAATLVSFVAISAIVGKLVIGWLVERYDKRLIFAGVCASNVAFLVTAVLAPPYVILLVVTSLVGIAIGGVYPVWTSITAQSFGREHFAPAIGYMNIITVFFTIVSIWFTARSHDITGSYNFAFTVFIPQAILAALIMMRVGRRWKNNISGPAGA